MRDLPYLKLWCLPAATHALNSWSLAPSLRLEVGLMEPVMRRLKHMLQLASVELVVWQVMHAKLKGSRLAPTSITQHLTALLPSRPATDKHSIITCTSQALKCCIQSTLQSGMS